MNLSNACLLCAVVLLHTACTSHAPFRAHFQDAPCVARTADMPGACANRMWERVGADYDMLYVEFDDMGLLHPKGGDRVGDAWDQIEHTMKTLTALSGQDGLSVVVFVHGWKHNAGADDSNVRQFRSILKNISLVEQAARPQSPRRVVGIYVGWRGLSVEVEPFKAATFWARKNAALHVAQGSARHFLARLRTFQRVQNCDANRAFCDPNLTQMGTLREAALRAKVRMLVIGHSFGGLIVFNAISGYLVESLTEEGQGSTEASRGAIPSQRFGDMVLLLNPAFEAIRYTPLQRVAARRSYPYYQAPILVMITSTADDATRVLFPLGRQLNSVLQHHGSEEEAHADIRTPGHMEAYLTHTLLSGNERPSTCEGWVESASVEEMRTNLRLEAEAANAFFLEAGDSAGETRRTLKDGWSRTFCGGTKLTHLKRKGNPDSPYAHNHPDVPIWNVQTDESLIPGHSDIYGSTLANFIRQLYHDSATTPIAP